MRYADTLLADGERIAYRARQHPLAVFLAGRMGVALVVAALALIVIDAWAQLSGGIHQVLGLVALILAVAGLLWLGRAYWRWSAEDYLITNRRVLKVEGILNKRSADSSLEKINDAVLSQDLFGRLLGYGDLEIMTAAEESVDVYRMLDRAPDFKRAMLNQKHALETDYVRPNPPTPPLRAPVAPAVAVRAAPPDQPLPAARTEAAQRPAMTADEVTATLGRLADLKDRGAITDEEYEAKKKDLLARL